MLVPVQTAIFVDSIRTVQKVLLVPAQDAILSAAVVVHFPIVKDTLKNILVHLKDHTFDSDNVFQVIKVLVNSKVLEKNVINVIENLLN